MYVEESLQKIVIVALVFVLSVLQQCTAQEDDSQKSGNYKIDGKVVVPFTADQEWITTTRVLIDGGEYLGFLRSDGAFTVNHIPSGSYLVEISHPTYVFEPARVDINSRGKLRARKVNNVQSSAVQHLTYPLKFKARGKASYFQVREQWRITDFLMNPMVLMMVLPFLIIMVLPKLINTADPETQKEMQSQMNILNTKQQMPDMAELITSMFGGGSKKTTKSKATKRRS